MTSKEEIKICLRSLFPFKFVSSYLFDLYLGRLKSSLSESPKIPRYHEMAPIHMPLKVQKKTSTKLVTYLKNLFADNCCISVQRVFQVTLKRSVTAQKNSFFIICHY